MDVAVQAAGVGEAGKDGKGATGREQAERERDFADGGGVGAWSGPGLVRPAVVGGDVGDVVLMWWSGERGETRRSVKVGIRLEGEQARARGRVFLPARAQAPALSFCALCSHL